jgi:hypothetical protein
VSTFWVAIFAGPGFSTATSAAQGGQHHHQQTHQPRHALQQQQQQMMRSQNTQQHQGSLMSPSSSCSMQSMKPGLPEDASAFRAQQLQQYEPLSYAPPWQPAPGNAHVAHNSNQGQQQQQQQMPAMGAVLDGPVDVSDLWGRPGDLSYLSSSAGSSLLDGELPLASPSSYGTEGEFLRGVGWGGMCSSSHCGAQDGPEAIDLDICAMCMMLAVVRLASIPRGHTSPHHTTLALLLVRTWENLSTQSMLPVPPCCRGGGRRWPSPFESARVGTASATAATQTQAAAAAAAAASAADQTTTAAMLIGALATAVALP